MRLGLAREVISRVQRLRKEAGYQYTDRIELSVGGATDVVAAVRAEKSLILRETLARGLVEGSDLPGADIRETVDLDGRQVVVALKRWEDEPETKAARVKPKSKVKKKAAKTKATSRRKGK